MKLGLENRIIINCGSYSNKRKQGSSYALLKYTIDMTRKYRAVELEVKRGRPSIGQSPKKRTTGQAVYQRGPGTPKHSQHAGLF
jgi:hypothetical protein